MRLKEIISEKYNKFQGQDIIGLVGDYLKWRAEIIPAVKDAMSRWDNEWKSELSEYRDELNEWKASKNEWKASKNENKGKFTAEKPIKPVRDAKHNLEDRIVHGNGSDVGLIFLRNDEDSVAVCGRAMPMGINYNCFSGKYRAISFAGSPRSFLLSRKFGVLFHEWWHSTQSAGRIVSDSGKLPHNLRIQEIDAVIATTLVPFVSKLRKRPPGDGAKRFMKNAGFKDDYGHFVRNFLPNQMTFVKSIMNDPGGPPWEYTDDLHRSTSVHKGFFSYLRAYYRGEYTPNMTIPDGYWVSDASDRERGT